MERTVQGVNLLRKFEVELTLAALALALYLPGVDWGLPYATDPARTHGWAYDAITPLDPLSQLKNLTEPIPHEWVAYPLMHHIVLAVVYSPYLLYLLATGRLVPGSAQYPFGLADPVDPELAQFSWLHEVSAGVFVATFLAALVCLICISQFRPRVAEALR